jgi:hypothetical protein
MKRVTGIGGISFKAAIEKQNHPNFLSNPRDS